MENLGAYRHELVLHASLVSIDHFLVFIPITFRQNVFYNSSQNHGYDWSLFVKWNLIKWYYVKVFPLVDDAIDTLELILNDDVVYRVPTVFILTAFTFTSRLYNNYGLNWSCVPTHSSYMWSAFTHCVPTHLSYMWRGFRIVERRYMEIGFPLLYL